MDPELLATFDKLGIPLNEQKRLANVAVDAVFDSVSIATTFKAELAKARDSFCFVGLYGNDRKRNTNVQRGSSV